MATAPDPRRRRRLDTVADLPRRALIASAAKIDLNDARYARGKAAAPWQDECWNFFDSIGECKYASSYLGNALSRLRLFIGEIQAGTEQPVQLETDADAEATDALDRLQSAVGGRSELQRKFGVNIVVAGECYLVGLEGPPEEWSIRSIDEVSRGTSGRWELRTEPGTGAAGARELKENQDYVARLWLPHARWSNTADSPLRGVRSVCTELLLHERANRGATRSRVAAAGFLLVPDELTFGSLDPTADDGSESSEEDPFWQGMLAAMLTAIQDEGSAASAVPILVRGAADSLKEFRYVPIDRPADKEVDKKIAALIRRLAQGLNVPPEVVLGLEDASHWAAWAIDESTFSAHIEPLAIAMCEMLTIGYLRPLLIAGGRTAEDVANLHVWYDATELVTHPNRGADADRGYEITALSAEAWRYHHGFAESDAPADNELLLRIAEKMGRAGPDVIAQLLQESGYAPNLRPPDPLQGPAGNPDDVVKKPGHVAPVPRATPETVQPGPPASGPPTQGPDAATASAAATIVYAALNPLLRRAEGNLEQLTRGVRDTVGSVDAIVAGSVVLEPLTIYRAWNHMPEQLTAAGVVMMEHGYTAGVTDREVALASCTTDDCGVVAIQVEVGQHGAWMGDRLLLPRNSAFEMIGQEDGITHMRLVEP